jgi:hypothetical protein
MIKKTKNTLSSALSLLPDSQYSKLTFFLKHKRLPRLNKSNNFSDQLLKMKLSTREHIYKEMVDKYEVRKFIRNSIGEEYLIPLIGVYDDPDQVDFERLPKKFVLKLTAGSQNNFICTDKSKVNWKKVSENVRKWLETDHYKRTREWQYKDLPAKFVIEEYISDKNDRTDDYKFWCFNGEPKLVQVDTQRFSNHKRSFYNAEDFEFLNLEITYKKAENKIEKPTNYEEMIDIARQLSKKFKFVRIDLYNIDGKVYFGEITFYPDNCNGKITPFEYEMKLGKYLSGN